MHIPLKSSIKVCVCERMIGGVTVDDSPFMLASWAVSGLKVGWSAEVSECIAFRSKLIGSLPGAGGFSETRSGGGKYSFPRFELDNEPGSGKPLLSGFVANNEPESGRYSLPRFGFNNEPRGGRSLLPRFKFESEPGSGKFLLSRFIFEDKPGTGRYSLLGFEFDNRPGSGKSFWSGFVFDDEPGSGRYPSELSESADKSAAFETKKAAVRNARKRMMESEIMNW